MLLSDTCCIRMESVKATSQLRVTFFFSFHEQNQNEECLKITLFFKLQAMPCGSRRVNTHLLMSHGAFAQNASVTLSAYQRNTIPIIVPRRLESVFNIIWYH